MKLNDKKSVTAFINSGNRHIKQMADSHGRITSDVDTLVSAMAEAYASKERAETEPAELARIYSAFSQQYHACFDPEIAKRKWDSFVTITGRKSKAKGFKPVPQKVQDQKDGNGIQYVAINLVAYVEPASSDNSGNSGGGNSGTRRNSNSGGNTQPNIKTPDQARAQMAVWIRQGVITETEMFDAAVSLFKNEAEQRKAFKGCGFLTKHETAAKVAAAVKKQKQVDKEVYTAEVNRANERAKSAVLSANEIKERA